MSVPSNGLARRIRTQRGDVLLIVLIFLMVFLLGLVVSMRGNIVTTQLVGNNLTRQKEAQVADIALRQIEGAMQQVSQGSPLELAAISTVAWWRDVPAGTAAPADPTYWSTCATTNAADATQRCYPVTVTLPGNLSTYKALAVVQPAGRSDSNTCNIAPFEQANYYDIFLRVQEASGATSTTTETVYRLCTRSTTT